MSKRAKKSSYRPLNTASPEITNCTPSGRPEADPAEDSDSSKVLIRAFNKYVAQQKITNVKEVNIKDVLLAISKDLAIGVPGWNKLTKK